MSGSRKRRLHVANTLGLACVAATCFLAACGDSDDSSDNPSKGGTGSGGKASAGSAGKAGGASAGNGRLRCLDRPVKRTSRARPAQRGEAGEAGADAGGTGGTGGSTAGTGGSVVGTGGSTGGSGGAPVVLTPNCVRDTTSGKRVVISPDGHDGLFAAAWHGGYLYAAGYAQASTGATEDRSTVVVRLTASGELDPSWATGGVATVNVKVIPTPTAPATLPNGQAELPRGLAFQGDKIIVAGTVEAFTTAQSQHRLQR